MVEITYHKEGDYYIPDLYFEKENYKNDYQIGKYGHLRFVGLSNICHTFLIQLILRYLLCYY